MESRIEDLERRVAALEALLEAPTGSDDQNSVTFSGNATIRGRDIEYLWVRPSTYLMEKDWSKHISRLDALAHPVRGNLMRYLLQGPRTVSEIVDKQYVSSPGTAYHHLSALEAAGWLEKDVGGNWSVPIKRVIPLLAIISATEDH